MNNEKKKKTYDQQLADLGFSAKEIYSLDATHTLVYKKIIDKIQKHFVGTVLDVGAGRDYFRTQAPISVQKWTSLDYESRTDSIDLNASALDLPIEDKTIDCVLLADVLEHLSDPEKAVKEIFRVLKDHGVAIVSAPFFLNLHEEPYDYFRFSKYGLQEILLRNGFEVISIEKTCGLFATIGYWITASLTKIFYFSRIVLRIVMFINKIFQRIAIIPLDQAVDKKGRFTQGHIVVVKKKIV